MATETLERERTTGPGITRRRATVEEFWALPESVLPAEYVNGEIVMAPTPTVRHQTVLRNMFRPLHDYAKNNKLGELYFSPLDVVLPTGEVVQPDIFLITPKQAERSLEAKRIQTVPPLMVEILSPGSVSHDAITKRDLYELNGVREYWIVNAKNLGIAQLVLRKKHYVLTELGADDFIKGMVLAGFEMRVGELLGL